MVKDKVDLETSLNNLLRCCQLSSALESWSRKAWDLYYIKRSLLHIRPPSLFFQNKKTTFKKSLNPLKIFKYLQLFSLCACWTSYMFCIIFNFNYGYCNLPSSLLPCFPIKQIHIKNAWDTRRSVPKTKWSFSFAFIYLYIQLYVFAPSVRRQPGSETIKSFVLHFYRKESGKTSWLPSARINLWFRFSIVALYQNQFGALVGELGNWFSFKATR